ncbi:MAG TPA: 4-(cytidine 5'-diphospho)-2-C-methyl-D-erythritol kinase [Alphaproteobacteria bacterium]
MPRDATAPVRIAARAKLNLYLHVLGRRNDGYHLIDSLVVFASVHDTVAVRPAGDLSLAADGTFAQSLPAGADNIAIKAARRLAVAAGGVRGAAIALTKELPVASGIGGGSADAAATLAALVRLWKLDLPQATLHALALELGADVPVCLHGRAAFMGGIGEAIAPCPPLPKLPLVLVNPGVPVATADVFRARQGGFSQPGRFDEAPADIAALARLLASRRNDLTDAARSIAPTIADVLHALNAEGSALARLSGSGATCFGIFADAAAAQTAARRIAAAQPRWWVRATETA